MNVASSDPGATLSGYVVNDVLLDFDSMLRGQQLSLQLTQGSIFQSAPLGAHTAPSAFAVNASPTAEFDSFVTMGGIDAGASAPVLTVGGAVDLAYLYDTSVSKAARFDSTVADITWAPAPGTQILSGDDFLTSRLTLSSDAQGTFRYLASAAGSSEYWIGEAQIVNGTIGHLTRRVFETVVPVEPTPPVPPVVPPVTQPEVPPVVEPPIVTPEPDADPLPNEPSLEIPSIVTEVPPHSFPIDRPIEFPLILVDRFDWLAPKYLLWEGRELAIDLSILLGTQYDLSCTDCLIETAGPAAFSYVGSDVDQSMTDSDGSSTNRLAAAISYSLFNSRTRASAFMAYDQAPSLNTSSVPEPSGLCHVALAIAMAMRLRRWNLG